MHIQRAYQYITNIYHQHLVDFVLIHNLHRFCCQRIRSYTVRVV